MTSGLEGVRGLLERAVPFLRDEGARYEDDGSNEPLELARSIEAELERTPPADTQQPEARGVVDEDAAEALRFLLDRIGSWTYARWDQHLRHEFGDERATRMIAALTEARNVR